MLRIVGSGDLRFVRQLHEKVRLERLEDSVTFVGHVSSGEAVRELYESSDVLVCPTLYAEGFPRVIYEAMAAGTPVVATNIAGARGILEPEANFIEVAGRSPEGLADAVTRLGRDTDLRATIARNAFAAVRVVERDVGASSHAEQVAKALLAEPPDQWTSSLPRRTTKNNRG